MSSASEAFKAGDLQAAITQQTETVKKNPSDQGARLFLFELLAFAGNFDRARKQFDAMTFDDPEQDLMGLQYKQVLDAEAQRDKVFSRGAKPAFVIEPVPEHVTLRLTALSQLQAGNAAEAAATLAQAAECTPDVGGRLNDKEVKLIRDCDDLLGNVLEVMAQGKYFWVPLEHIASLAMAPPRFPRDLLWFPARLEALSGESGEVYLPAVYPGTHKQDDDALKLGRQTDWKSDGDGPVRGIGSKTLLVDDDVMGLLELREFVAPESDEQESANEAVEPSDAG